LQTEKTMQPIYIAAALTVMAIWGTNFSVSKVAVQAIPPMALMAVRFVLVAAVLLPFVRAPRGKMKGIFLYSLVWGGLHFSLMLTGLAKVDASVASVVIQLQVPFASLLAALFFGDKLGWRRGMGMALAFCGVIVIAMGRSGGDVAATSLPHLLMILGAALAFSVSNAQVKWMGEVSAFQLNAYASLFAAPQLFLLSLWLEEGQVASFMVADVTVWLCLGYMALFSTIVAYGLWQPFVRRFDVNQTAPFLLLVPVFGVGVGVAWLGEPLSMPLILGGVLVLAGVAVILIRRPRTLALPSEL
jgi:O-acetylserine/cysteine efflux transporter